MALSFNYGIKIKPICINFKNEKTISFNNFIDIGMGM
jgi:hypothetical protein